MFGRRGLQARTGPTPSAEDHLPAVAARTVSGPTLRRWISGATLAVGVLGIVFRSLIDVPITQILQLVGCLLTAVSAPILMYYTTIEILNGRLQSLRSLPLEIGNSASESVSHIDVALSRGLVGYFAAFAGSRDLHGDEFDLDARRLLADVCLPITSRTVQQQHGLPLLTDYDLDISMSDLVITGVGQVAVFTRTATYQLYLPSQADVSRLFPPVLVVDSRALAMDAVTELQRSGRMDFLWPLAAGSIGAVAESALRKVDWITVDPIRLGKAVVRYSEKRRPSAAEIRDVLGEALPQPVRASELDQLAEMSIVMGYVDLTDETRADLEAELGEDRTVSPTVKSTYRVLVWPKNAQPIDRYEIPLARPATIRRMRFSVGGRLRQTIRLTRAAVYSSWPMSPSSNPEHPYEQDLAWTGIGTSRGAPFLPGHGVTFHWERIGPLTPSDAVHT